MGVFVFEVQHPLWDRGAGACQGTQLGSQLALLRAQCGVASGHYPAWTRGTQCLSSSISSPVFTCHEQWFTVSKQWLFNKYTEWSSHWSKSFPVIRGLFKVLFCHENKTWFQDPPKLWIKLLQICSLKVRWAVTKFRRNPSNDNKSSMAAQSKADFCWPRPLPGSVKGPGYLGSLVQRPQTLWVILGIGTGTFNKSLNQRKRGNCYTNLQAILHQHRSLNHIFESKEHSKEYPTVS